ncbi:MAG TPA: STAS domain-containing protein [Acidimicrobiales bacterium]|nr:STAS domain-containing protein [Acidimicrobiales bacterium]
MQPLAEEPRFDVSVERLDGESVVVFRGELDMSATDELSRSIEKVRSPDRPLIIDLAGTTFMDSSGVHVLLTAYRAQGRGPGSVVLRSPSHAVRYTLALTGVADALTIDDGAGSVDPPQPTR